MKKNSFLLLIFLLTACGSPSTPVGLTPESLAFDSPQSAEINAPLIESPALVTIQFLNSRDAWGVTETQIVRTNDGGITWYDVTPPELSETGYTVNAIALDSNHAWVQKPDFDNYPNGGFLYRTSDGGMTWDAIQVPFSDASLQFLDSRNGWALANLGIGAGSNAIAIYQTTDGGGLWSLKFTNDPNRAGSGESLPLGGLKFGLTPSNMETAWVYGVIYAPGTPYLYRTDDAGVSWSQVSLPLPPATETAEFSIEAHALQVATAAVLALHLTGDAPQTAFYTSNNGGDSWSLKPTLLPGYGKLDVLSPKDMIVYAGGQFYVTTDAANTWSMVASDILFGDSLVVMDFVNISTGFVLAHDATTNRRSLYHTENGGVTWFPLVP